jgi:hypothetical protein
MPAIRAVSNFRLGWNTDTFAIDSYRRPTLLPARCGNSQLPSMTTNVGSPLAAARSHVVRDPPGAHLDLAFPLLICCSLRLPAPTTWERDRICAGQRGFGARRFALGMPMIGALKIVGVSVPHE